MRFSASLVVAGIVMQNIKENALSTCQQTRPIWLRYVDHLRHDESMHSTTTLTDKTHFLVRSTLKVVFLISKVT